MAEEIAFENGRISNFQGLVTLTLDRVILHTVMYHSSTSTYTPNFIEIEETFCGRMDGHLRPALLGRLLSQPNKQTNSIRTVHVCAYHFAHL